MRVQRPTVLTAAVLGLVLLSGCRADGTDGPAAVPTGSASAPAPGAPSGPAQSSPAAPARPSGEARPSAGARRVVDAPKAGGLARATGAGAPSDVTVDPGEMRDGMNLVMNNYVLPKGGSALTIAVDNVPEETGKRREHLWRGMLEHIKWDPELGQPEAQPVDAGPLGGSVECMLASLAEDGDVVCGWADDGTAGVAHFPDSTLPQAAKLFVAMRGDLEK
ncbi:hypothetical protein [Streptomyces fradiae]|uniref:hypothetical protein n=1 Tax=Streptomyces fradiae TaxID=1906 RepID=UPI0033FC8867